MRVIPAIVNIQARNVWPKIYGPTILVGLLVIIGALWINSISLLLPAQVVGDVVIERTNERLVITVVGIGDSSVDQVNTERAVAILEANGGGTLGIKGTVTLNDGIDFTTPVSIEGMSPDATIASEITNSSTLLAWNRTYSPASTSQNTFFDITADEGDEVFNVTNGETLNEGDWVILQSENQIPNVPPHFGVGAGQHPMELHLVKFYDTATNKAYVDGHIVDDMTAAANAKGAVVELTSGIRIRNLRLTYSGSGTLHDFAIAMYFRKCQNVVVEPSVIVDRHGPGSISFSHSANCKCYASVNGSYKIDLSYGIVADVVNGLLCDGIYRGTRHVFTTTAGYTVSAETDIIESVDDGTETLTLTGHGFDDGEHVRITGTPPGGLATETHYWIVNETANTVQLAATPGGVAVNITNTTAGATLRREGRWGTPIGVVCKGIAFVGSKVTTPGPSMTDETLVWDTHAEGWQVQCGMTFIGSADADANWAINTRARGTTFQNCRIVGGLNPQNFQGITIRGPQTRVLNCSFERLWRGIKLDLVGTNAEAPDDCIISGNYFEDVRNWSIFQSAGDNVTILNNVFKNCGWGSGGSPHATKSLIQLVAGTGHVISGNNMRAWQNVQSIDTGQLESTDLEVDGNHMTGYASGTAGFGRIITVDATQADETFTVNDANATSHGLSSNDIVRFTGSVPTGISLSTDYYVISVDADEFQVSATPGPGGAVNLTSDSTCNFQVRDTHDFESTYSGLNVITP